MSTALLRAVPGTSFFIPGRYPIHDVPGSVPGIFLIHDMENLLVHGMTVLSHERIV